jgi:uncharacterized membrane protein YraQ (UPF0718 family)
MKLGFKKWFSILGLLLAIIISLGIGTYFDLSILEGMAPGEEEGEEMPVEEEGDETPVEDDAPVEETPVKDEREEDVDMTLAEISDPESPNKKKSGQEVYKNVMNNGTTESFSLIRNF